MGRHVLTDPLGPRHRAPNPADDLPSLEELVRTTAGLPAVRTDPMNPRPDLPPIPDALRPAAERWATPPGAFDDEVLHTVRLGEVHAEPPTWGGRGVRL